MAAVRDIMAIIPARSGSKGLVCKNIRPLGGKPLLAWTIEQALACKEITRVVVSTDSKDIAAIAHEYGAEVPFLRPSGIAGDTSLLGDAVKHTVNHYIEKESIRVDIVLTLLPSHPFRTKEMFTTAVAALKKDSFRTFSTMAPVWTPPGKIVIRQGDRIMPIQANDRGLPHVYYRNYGLLNGQKLDCAYGKDYAFAVTDKRYLVDVDTIEDLKQAENLLAHHREVLCA